LASLCFVVVGVPLGIKAQRRESTIGMAVALAVSLGYYMIVILALSLEKDFRFHPELLMWLPVLACGALAARLIPKNL
jgi:lipopolysaccharide export system permease protein